MIRLIDKLTFNHFSDDDESEQKWKNERID